RLGSADEDQHVVDEHRHDDDVQDVVPAKGLAVEKTGEELVELPADLLHLVSRPEPGPRPPRQDHCGHREATPARAVGTSPSRPRAYRACARRDVLERRSRDGSGRGPRIPGARRWCWAGWRGPVVRRLRTERGRTSEGRARADLARTCVRGCWRSAVAVRDALERLDARNIAKLPHRVRDLDLRTSDVAGIAQVADESRVLLDSSLLVAREGQRRGETAMRGEVSGVKW